MADEQTPQSDLIDDAIRQAERQLEEKLNALRMSALGEPSPAAPAPADDDVAVLRPTGRTPRSEAPAAPYTGDAHAGDEQPVLPAPADAGETTRWAEAEGDDLTFAPVGEVPSAGVSDLYVPEYETPFDDEPASTDLDVFGEVDEFDGEHPQVSGLRESLGATVTDLTPVWDDDEPSTTHVAPMPTTRRSSEQPRARRTEEPAAPAPREDRPEPVHASWTEPARGGSAPQRREPVQRITSLPSEDEMQFWAHTRTALRNLQQVTDGIPTQVVGGVSTEVSRLLHEQLGATEQQLRTLSGELTRATQQELPQLADEIQRSIEQAVAAPNNAIRQVRDEIPAQVDRGVAATQEHLRDELDRTAANVHNAVQHDITQLEQSIASNVTRMAQGTTDAIGRVEHDVDVLGETVVRFERGVHGEFDRFESQLRAAIERVEQNLRDELVTPTETVRKLDDELPARFERVERTVSEQLQSGQRDQQQVLTSLVEADRAALDRLQSLASTLDEDRARRAEDLDVVVDTVTSGWEALAGAMAALFEQAEQNSRRLAGIEQRLTQIRDLEGAVEQALDRFQRHMADLKPSPIVVTVSHDEAEVRNTTRAGWTPDTTGA